MPLRVLCIISLPFVHSNFNYMFWLKSLIYRPAWPRNLMDDQKNLKLLLYATSNCVNYFVAICDFKLELWSGNAQSSIFWPVRPSNLANVIEKRNRPSPLYRSKVCVWFRSHRLVQTWVTVPKFSKSSICRPMCYWNLMDDLDKLCASLRSHLWIEAGVTVRKHPNH